MIKTMRAVALALLAAASAGGCADVPSPTEPGDEVSTERPFFSSAPAPGFDVMARTVPLASAYAAKAVFDGRGGKLSIPPAGIELVIPSGALSSSTTIALYAHAGDRVAFTFEPHGLTFERPVQLRFDVVNTEAEYLLKQYGMSGPILLSDLLGVYYEGDPTKGPVDPKENFRVVYRDGQIRFNTPHFSGYAIAM